MKNFRGTLMLALIVLIVGGLALTEFKKAKEEETTAPLQDDLFQGVTVGDVTEAQLKYGSSDLTLTKNGEVWTVKWTAEDAGNPDAINSFLGSVISQEVVSVETEGEPKWDQYGLNSPSGFLRLKRAGGQETKIEFGSRSYDEGFYARRVGETKLLVAKKGLESFLQKAPNEFRTRRLQIPNGEVTKLDLRSNRKGYAGAWSFEKRDGRWVNLKDEKMAMSQSTFDSYLSDLRALDGSEIISDDLSAKGMATVNLTKPEIEVKATIKPSDGDAQIFTLKVSADKDGNRNMFGSANKAVLRIAANNEAFKKSLRDFRDRRFPFQTDISGSGGIKILREKGGVELSLKKNGADWQEDPPVSGRKIATSTVAEILGEIPQLEAYDVLAKGSKKLIPEYHYKFFAPDGKSTFELVFGGPFTVEGTDYYVAKTSNFDGLLQIEKSKLDGLNAKNLITYDPTPTPTPSPEQTSPPSAGDTEKKDK